MSPDRQSAALRTSNHLSPRLLRRSSPLRRPGFTLAPESDTGILGDFQTTAATVDLIGLTSPGARVRLQSTAYRTIADQSGRFLFTNVPIAIGPNRFTTVATVRSALRSRLTATANTLSTRQFTTMITRDLTNPGDAVLSWNAIALRTLQIAQAGGLSGSRSLAIVQSAVFDVVDTLTAGGRHLPAALQIVADVPVAASIDLAIAGAAYQTLVQLYPEQQSRLDAALDRAIELSSASEDSEIIGLRFGQSIGDQIFQGRQQDGSAQQVKSRSQPQPGTWRPTPPQFLPAAGAGWGQVTPFVLTQPQQFRPAAPPALTSATYAREFNQVKRLGQLNSPDRTAAQTNIARFWIGSPGTSSAPGQWNEIAAQLAVKTGQTLWQNAQLLYQLNLSLADAGIAAWDTKFAYRSWRPITAIRLAGSDSNPKTQPDRTWESFLETPPHPDYVSGHSTYAGAAATILTSRLGELSFSATSLDLPGIRRHFPSFQSAAAEAGLSRIYGGIHTRSANRSGLQLGRNVANYVLQTRSSASTAAIE